MDTQNRVRSQRLLDSAASRLLVIDIQDRLVPAIKGRDRIIWNASRLLRAAQEFSVPAITTEQYPEKLGDTVPELQPFTENRESKRVFSCRECSSAIPLGESQQERAQLVIAGIEAHVCVLQTALDFLADHAVYVVVDAVGSRSCEDRDIAFRRMEQAGVQLVTTESVLFEWCDTSLAPQFKAISALVREVPPNSE